MNMQKIIPILFILLLMRVHIYGQEKLEVEGALKLANSSLVQPEAGTIRWMGSDFEGYNGTEWISLTGKSTSSTVQDVDGNIYQTRKIGDQIWMAENLRTTHYNNGVSIIGVTDGNLWKNATAGAWCWYDNNSSFEIPYGKLYNWFAFNDVKGLCPEGWHVPYEFEWIQLGNFLGSLDIAGGSLKEAGTDHWTSPNSGADNITGFTALPGGNRDDQGLFFLISILQEFFGMQMNSLV